MDTRRTRLATVLTLTAFTLGAGQSDSCGILRLRSGSLRTGGGSSATIGGTGTGIFEFTGGNLTLGGDLVVGQMGRGDFINSPFGLLPLVR
jgi:hypothetical protein